MPDGQLIRQRKFETTNLPLAASLLCQVQGATLLRVCSKPSVDGKRLLVVGYLPDQAEAVQDVIEQFHGRRLVVPLYLYNRVLNTLRDRLKQDDGSHAIR